MLVLHFPLWRSSQCLGVNDFPYFQIHDETFEHTVFMEDLQEIHSTTSVFMNLQQAVASGSKEKILELLKEDVVDLKTTDDNGNTLLHAAFGNETISSSEQKLCDILQIFLDRGCDINVKNKLGKTILHLAVERRMRDVIDFCLRRNANKNPRHRRRNSIAHFAIEEVCRKYPINAVNVELFEYETSSFIDWMVSRGFDFFYTKNSQNYCPLYLANDLNVQHVLFALLKRIERDDLSKIERGQTPLLRAFLEKNYDSYSVVKGWSGALNSICPVHFRSRYTYDIVKVILEKSKSIYDETLHASLRLTIEKKEKICVVNLLAERVKNVIPWLIEVFSNSFEGTSSDWDVKDKMEILKCLMMKCHGDVTELTTLGQQLFRRHPTLEMLRILKDARVDFNLYSSNSEENFLHLISRYGRGSGLIDLVMNNRKSHVNIVNSKGESPLITAIVCKNEDAARELMKHGATIDISALLLACETGQVRVVEKMIKLGVNLKHRSEDGRTLLHLSLDHPKMIDLLLENGLSVNARDDDGKTPLYFAMTDKIHKNDNSSLAMAFKAGQIEVLEKLIERGAELKYRNDNGQTLLHLAVKYPKVVELLLKSGLDVNAKDCSGRTALSMACEVDEVRVQEKLIEYGANLDYRDEHGRTLLHLSVKHLSLVEFLLDKGVHVDAKDSSGKTPLVMACEVGQVRVQKKLIEHGADLNCKGPDNKTLLHLAVGHYEVSDLLLNSGLDFNARDNFGKSPLHYAKGNRVVKFLAKAGARLDAVDNEGNTPLYDALSNVYSTVDSLISCGADLQEPKVFQLALQYFKDPYNMNIPLELRYLKRHLIKMYAAGLLSEMPPTRNNILEEELKMYLKIYQDEVELLKTCFVDDRTSLYDFLHKDRNHRCVYVNNATLKTFLQDMGNRKKFYNCFVLVQACYNEAASRKNLLKLASDVLSQLGQINLPNFCSHMIFEHLSNVDIVRLIQVYEDLIRSKFG